MYSLLRYLPRNYLSYACGTALRCRLPAPLARRAVSLFARKFRIDTSEISGELQTFRSIGEFFTRDLKPGSRPLGCGLVSPVDAELIEAGSLDADAAFDVKGRRYSAAQLLRDDALARVYQNGFFFVLYLSPRDYHHVHSPADGAIVQSIHIEGTLWPVNSWSLSNVDGVFALNERIVTVIKSPEFGSVSVVKVGATNVGSIRLHYDDVRANRRLRQRVRRAAIHRKTYDPGIAVCRGERIATFELGSTVILLVERGSGDAIVAPGHVKYGQSLGVACA